MKKLYARIVLLLIRPALEADRKERMKGEKKSHSPSEGGRIRSAEDEAILAEALEEYRTRAQGNAEEHLKDLVIALRKPFRHQSGLADLQQPQSLCETHRDQERPVRQECAQERQTPPAAPVRDQ